MVKGQKKFEQEMLVKYSNVCQPKNGWQRLATDVFKEFGLKALIPRIFSDTVKDPGIKDPHDFAERIIQASIESGEGFPYWPWQVKMVKQWFEEFGERSQRILTAWYGLKDDDSNLPTVADIASSENLDERRVYEIRKIALKRFRIYIKYIKPRLATWADIYRHMCSYEQACKELKTKIDGKNQQIRELKQTEAQFEALKGHLKTISLIVDEPKPEEKPTEETGETYDRMLDYRIEDLGFTVRTYNCLVRADWRTLREMLKHTEPEYRNLRNWGNKSMTELKDKLAALGLSLPEPPEQIEDKEDLPLDDS